MKKVMFLFLVMVFVAFMAIGAMAVEEEVDCCCPEDCSDQAVLLIDFEVKNLCCIQMVTDHVSLFGHIGCGCAGDNSDFDYKVWATGDPKVILGQLTVDLDMVLEDACQPWLNVDMGEVIGIGPVRMNKGDSGVLLARFLACPPICGPTFTGNVKLCVPPTSSPHSGNAQLLFTIMDDVT